MPAPIYTKEQRAEMIRLVNSGLRYVAVAKIIGCRGEDVRNVYTRSKPAAAEQSCRFAKPTREDFTARLAEIPADTRSLTARAFGDPLPGRSALDRRSSGVPV